MFRMSFHYLMIAVLLIGCAGPNPNPGERTADMAWSSGSYAKSFSIVKPSAERGEPWAQLRLGIFYENGWGTEVDYSKAEYWYTKAAEHKAEGDWADGKLVGATGKPGYFNQNSDALIAEYNLASMYYNAPEGIKKDLEKAHELIEKVLMESGGNSIFFCCEFDGGRYFTQEQFRLLKSSIMSQLNKDR